MTDDNSLKIYKNLKENILCSSEISNSEISEILSFVSLEKDFEEKIYFNSSKIYDEINPEHYKKVYNFFKFLFHLLSSLPPTKEIVYSYLTELWSKKIHPKMNLYCKLNSIYSLIIKIQNKIRAIYQSNIKRDLDISNIYSDEENEEKKSWKVQPIEKIVNTLNYGSQLKTEEFIGEEEHEDINIVYKHDQIS